MSRSYRWKTRAWVTCELSELGVRVDRASKANQAQKTLIGLNSWFVLLLYCVAQLENTNERSVGDTQVCLPG